MRSGHGATLQTTSNIFPVSIAVRLIHRARNGCILHAMSESGRRNRKAARAEAAPVADKSAPAERATLVAIGGGGPEIGADKRNNFLSRGGTTPRGGRGGSEKGADKGNNYVARTGAKTGAAALSGR